MSTNTILNIRPLGFQWETKDPFLFCVHHEDYYPSGNKYMGPNAPLGGRSIGNDFTIKDGWRMYHGRKVPGFPAHPHRGFETVTYVRKGLIDHADSMGATGRFGNGDVQWMTAGKGVQHAEMFPLLNEDKDNPLELFQIWLNLPKEKKFAEPHYAMLWSEDIPLINENGTNGSSVQIALIAGDYGNHKAPAPAPSSWAANPDNEVAIWTIKMKEGSTWVLPPAKNKVNRSLYFYEGNSVTIDGKEVKASHAIDLLPTQKITINCYDKEANMLLLQGKPINEPVAQYGPFVMNSQAEILQTMEEYQRTQFGGWPWPSHEYVHPREKGRFALFADGTEVLK
ncbi:MAG: pirin family protein [Cyclobacteriaceae bacterium]|nr:pirin family protein [Cyclobacteriaceae bacterium]